MSTIAGLVALCIVLNIGSLLILAVALAGLPRMLSLRNGFDRAPWISLMLHVGLSVIVLGLCCGYQSLPPVGASLVALAIVLGEGKAHRLPVPLDAALTGSTLTAVLADAAFRLL